MIKQLILSTLSRSDRKLHTWIASLTVSQLLCLLAWLGLDVSGAFWLQLSALATTTLVALIETWISRENSKAILTMQTALQKSSPDVKLDGWAGPVTVEAAVSAAAVKTLDDAAMLDKGGSP